MTNREKTLLARTVELIEFDKAYNVPLLCGVDEAGRGPLAGPVVVCACRLPLSIPIVGIFDSKSVSAAKREELYEKIIVTADYCVVMIDEKTIDEINILNATKLGMKQAIEGLKVKPTLAVIDAVKGLDVAVTCDAVVKADEKSYNTAAASIIAKVTRDRYMQQIDKIYPEYGFGKNKGYGTAEHIAALKRIGACPYHRRTFIGNFINNENLSESVNTTVNGEDDVRNTK